MAGLLHRDAPVCCSRWNTLFHLWIPHLWRQPVEVRFTRTGLFCSFLPVFLFAKPFKFCFSKEICNEDIGGNIVMCPLCDKKCGYWKLSTTCNSSWVRPSVLIANLFLCSMHNICHKFLSGSTAIAPLWQCGNCVFCHLHGDLGWVKGALLWGWTTFQLRNMWLFCYYLNKICLDVSSNTVSGVVEEAAGPSWIRVGPGWLWRGATAAATSTGIRDQVHQAEDEPDHPGVCVLGKHWNHVLMLL